GGLLQIVSQLGSDLEVGSGRAARRLFGRSQTVDVMLGILNSRFVRGEVVDRFDLVEVYDLPGREHAIRALQDHLVADTTPEGLIRVSVEDRDPERAAGMTNAFLEVLDDFNRRTSAEDARRTVEFISGVLETNLERRREAADRLRSFQEEHGAIQIAEQTRVTVEALAELQARRMQLEIEAGVIQRYASPGNTDLRRIRDEILEIEDAIRALDGTAGAGPDSTDAVGPGGALLRLVDLPRLGMEYADMKREVLVQESVYEFLSAQYEEARIQETRDQRTIQFLDEAVPPIKKSRPRRSLIVLLTTILAGAAAVGVALAGDGLLSRFDEADSSVDAERVTLAPVLAILSRLRSWGTRPADASR
ncbi:MAG TPA: GNVR domain-containing protein, partial [bacterium]|nr:GNVR domain-containing protein [bacterium]